MGLPPASAGLLLLLASLLCTQRSGSAFVVLFTAGAGEERATAPSHRFSSFISALDAATSSSSTSHHAATEMSSAFEPLLHPYSWLEQQLDIFDALKQATLENLVIDRVEVEQLRELGPRQVEAEMLQRVGCQRLGPAMQQYSTASFLSGPAYEPQPQHHLSRDQADSLDTFFLQEFDFIAPYQAGADAGDDADTDARSDVTDFISLPALIDRQHGSSMQADGGDESEPSWLPSIDADTHIPQGTYDDASEPQWLPSGGADVRDADEAVQRVLWPLLRGERHTLHGWVGATPAHARGSWAQQQDAAAQQLDATAAAQDAALARGWAQKFEELQQQEDEVLEQAFGEVVGQVQQRDAARVRAWLQKLGAVEREDAALARGWAQKFDEIQREDEAAARGWEQQLDELQQQDAALTRGWAEKFIEMQQEDQDYKLMSAADLRPSAPSYQTMMIQSVLTSVLSSLFPGKAGAGGSSGGWSTSSMQEQLPRDFQLGPYDDDDEELLSAFFDVPLPGGASYALPRPMAAAPHNQAAGLDLDGDGRSDLELALVGSGGCVNWRLLLLAGLMLGTLAAAAAFVRSLLALHGAATAGGRRRRTVPVMFERDGELVHALMSLSDAEDEDAEDEGKGKAGVQQGAKAAESKTEVQAAEHNPV